MTGTDATRAAKPRWWIFLNTQGLSSASVPSQTVWKVSQAKPARPTKDASFVGAVCREYDPRPTIRLPFCYFGHPMKLYMTNSFEFFFILCLLFGNFGTGICPKNQCLAARNLLKISEGACLRENLSCQDSRLSPFFSKGRGNRWMELRNVCFHLMSVFANTCRTHALPQIPRLLGKESRGSVQWTPRGSISFETRIMQKKTPTELSSQC